MIRLLCKAKWLTLTKVPTNAPTQSCSIIHSQSLKFICSIISPQNHHYSFTISDLINSPNTVKITASKISSFKSSERPNLVLKLLQDHNFSENQVKLIVSRCPLILLADPNKTLKPKIEFLRSMGISEPDVVKMITKDPFVLGRSLKKQIIPLFDFIKSLVGNKENAARVCKSCPVLLRCSIEKHLRLNIVTLRNFGVPDSQISRLILLRPKLMTIQPFRFNEVVTTVKEMGFNPKDLMFGLAASAFGWSSKLTWEAKMDVYRSYGLSNDEILAAFKKQPTCMMLKEKKVRAGMDFFVKTLHWSPSKVLARPNILLLSLEGRIVPRSSVLHVLVSRKLVRRNLSILSMFSMTEKDFVKKYVTKYQNEAPQVLDALQGRLKIDDFNIISGETSVAATL